MSNPYHLDDDENGEQVIFREMKPMSKVQTVCELSDLYYKNQKLKQRLNDLRGKLIRFAEEELTNA